jgi:hypothetical protein
MLHSFAKSFRLFIFEDKHVSEGGVVRILASLVIRQEQSIEEIGYPPFIHLRLFLILQHLQFGPCDFHNLQTSTLPFTKGEKVSILGMNSDELCS